MAKAWDYFFMRIHKGEMIYTLSKWQTRQAESIGNLQAGARAVCEVRTARSLIEFSLDQRRSKLKSTYLTFQGISKLIASPPPGSSSYSGRDILTSIFTT